MTNHREEMNARKATKGQIRPKYPNKAQKQQKLPEQTDLPSKCRGPVQETTTLLES